MSELVYVGKVILYLHMGLWVYECIIHVYECMGIMYMSAWVYEFYACDSINL